MTTGILAYGSLLDNPGAELACTVQRIEEVETPFNVEFARESHTRDGGPTLVPVEPGGCKVEASVLVLKENIDEESARNMLYRRETHRVGESVTYRGRGVDWICTTPVPGLDACLYTALDVNIDPLTAGRLAELAIKSASRAAGMERRDGISYLEVQRRRGLETPLTADYEREILSRTGAQDLADAWARARAHADC